MESSYIASFWIREGECSSLQPYGDLVNDCWTTSCDNIGEQLLPGSDSNVVLFRQEWVPK